MSIKSDKLQILFWCWTTLNTAVTQRCIKPQQRCYSWFTHTKATHRHTTSMLCWGGPVLVPFPCLIWWLLNCAAADGLPPVAANLPIAPIWRLNLIKWPMSVHTYFIRCLLNCKRGIFLVLPMLWEFLAIPFILVSYRNTLQQPTIQCPQFPPALLYFSCKSVRARRLMERE